jgi:hypothetical protein
MSFQKQSISKRKTPGSAPEAGGIVSLIHLAANLDDTFYHRAIVNPSFIFEELPSINAKRTQQLGGRRALGRYIE